MNILWNPSSENIGVLTSVSTVISVSSMNFRKGFFNERGPQFSWFRGIGSDDFPIGFDENAMIHVYTTRNAVKKETDRVFSVRIYCWPLIDLGENNSRNQGLIETEFIERARNHGGDNGAVRDIVLQMRLRRRKACLDNTKGVQCSANNGDRTVHIKRVFKKATLLEKLGRERVIVGILIHYSIGD